MDRPRAGDVRAVRRAGRAGERGRRRVARRRHRPVLDARLAEPDLDRARVRDGRRQGPHHGRPARSRLLGAVVPRRLGDGDARADPPLVLLAALHVGGAHRAGAVQARARLREDARRVGPRDARLVGEHDPGRGCLRADGRRRDALAVLRAAAEPEPALRLRAGPRDPAWAADVLELGEVPRRLRADREVRAELGGARARRPRAAAARPLARRADPAARGRGDRGLRGDVVGERDPRVRAVRRRRLELVHPPFAAPLLRLRRGCLPHALVRVGAVAARDGAGAPVPHRRPVAEPGAGRPGVRAPRTVARGRRTGPRCCSTRSPRYERS